MQTKDGQLIDIRIAKPSDHAFLRELHHAAYRDVVTRQFGEWVQSDQDRWFDEKNVADATIRIIEMDGICVGAIGVEDAPDHVFLRELQVLPEFQNQGIGTQVLLAELERGAALGLPIRLRVLQQNRARQLYERHEFVVTGETETHYLMEWKA